MGLIFFSRSKEWRFLKFSTLNAIVGDKRFPLGDPASKDSDIPTVTSVYEDSRLSEDLYFRIPYRTLTIFAQANRVEMQLGRSEFTLPPSFLEDLRLLLAKVKRVK